MATVVVVASYAPSLVNFRGPLLREMLSRGHKVVSIAPDASPEIRRQLSELGVSYFDLGANRTGMNPVDDVLYLYRLFRLIRRLSPDVMLSYTIKPVVYGSVAARLTGTERICSLITGLGFAFDEPRYAGSSGRRIARMMLRLGLAASDQVIVQNTDDLAELVAEKLISKKKNTGVVNGSGVDLERFVHSPVESKVPEFLLIARLLGNKGIREYANAARSIKALSPSVRFHLIGWFDGNPAGLDKSEIDGWVKEGLLEFHGEVEDVRPWLRRCSVYVLPSYREGTPRTVLEAMATGRAIITTDVPGCRQTVVDGHNGYLVKARDTGSLAEAMKKFVEEPELAVQMGYESRKIVKQKYDAQMVSQQMLQLMRLN